jgi:hypothetical protein
VGKTRDDERAAAHAGGGGSGRDGPPRPRWAAAEERVIEED